MMVTSMMTISSSEVKKTVDSSFTEAKAVLSKKLKDTNADLKSIREAASGILSKMPKRRRKV